MPSYAQRRPSGPAPASTSPGQASAGGRSNADQQARLAEKVGGPLAANPAPWAAQGRAVQFQPVAGGELFRGGAGAGDVVQGQNGQRYLGDCWLLSSLAAIAQTQPQVLEGAITDLGDGTYRVRLHRQERSGEMKAEDVRVEGSLPKTADGRDAYAQRTDPKELWVGIIEKAFAAWKGGYGALDGGVPSDALTALTGRPTQTAFSQGTTPEALGASMSAASAAKQPMVAASRGDLSLAQGGIVPGHGHTVMRVHEEGGQTMVTLRDPFARYEPSGQGAKDGVFTIPIAEYQKRFQYTTWTQPEGPTAP